MSTDLQSQNLSLYQIESELLELMALREEVETDEERAACDKQIAAYVEREVRKVDKIRGFIRHAEMMADTARVEAAAQTERARIWTNRVSRVKQMCLEVMQATDMKRLEGRTGTLSVSGNGGVQPLAVDAWDREAEKWTGTSLLPAEYKTVLVRMPETFLAQFATGAPIQIIATEPANQRIREALAAGEGVPGAYLEQRGVHLRVK